MAIFHIRKTYVIGTINFDENLNEVTIGDSKSSLRFKNSFKGQCSIEIYDNEGINMPHFHIVSSDKKFNCCICIFDNRFFNHGTHQSILHRKDWKILDEWMRKPNKDDKTVTNWIKMVDDWKQLYDPKGKLNFDYDNQPDYTIIKPYKEK